MHKFLGACIVAVVILTAVFGRDRRTEPPPAAPSTASVQPTEAPADGEAAREAIVTPSGAATRRTPLAIEATPTLAGAPEAAPPAADSTSPPPPTIALLDRRGRPATLTIDETTEALVFATWCGVSARLNRALKDPRAAPHLDGKRLVYVFDYNELEHHLAPRVRRGEITQQKVDEYVAEFPRGPHLVHPEMLDALAAREVYYYDAGHPLAFGGFPSAFSAAPNKFELNYGVWMSRSLGIPAALKSALLDKRPSGQ
jgi:hypothetical protein